MPGRGRGVSRAMSRGRNVVLALLAMSIFLNYVERGSLSIAAPLLEKDLARREFVPVVTRILNVSSRVEPSRWEIDTDRGRTQLVLKNSEDVRRLGEKRAVIRDDQGIRYLVPDWTRLDAHSRKILEQYL